MQSSRTVDPIQQTPHSFDELRVLVVDDMEDQATTLSAMLELEGCKTCVAFDGYKAMSIAKVFKPQLAIVDLQMPGMNGVALAQRLRELHPALVLACLSGNHELNVRELCLLGGFDHVLLKPIQPTVLVAVLRIARSKAVSAGQ